MCKKLGNGKITSLINSSNMSKSLNIKYGVFDHECRKFWTPYVYSNSEGIARNENTGAQEILGGWIPGFPENYTGSSDVIFLRETRNFENLAGNSIEVCLVCNTSLKTTYQMRGNCKHSLLGNRKFIANMNNKYLGFFGDGIRIW